MARLPVPGSDDNVWGQILNDFLSAIHNVDGTLKANVVSTTNIVDASVTAAKLADTFILLSQRGVANGVASLDGGGLVPPSQLPPAGAVPDATTTSKGIIQLGGDISGTATNVTVPGLATKIDVSTVTAKGDLIAATGAGAVLRLGVGVNGRILTADSTQTTGLSWATITAAQLPDATTISKGIVQLAGDLGGTALSPSVLQINGVAVSGTPASGNLLTATSSTTATWQAPAADADTLAGDTDVTITTPLNGDVLTFNSGTTKWVNQPAPVTSVAGKTGAVTLVEGDITNLTTDLAAKANDNAVVHLAGTETITGAKTFNTNNLTITDVNVVLSATTGTKIGTATTQKLGFFNAAPIAQPTGDISTALSNLGLVSSPTIAEADITNLTTDLSNKVNTSSLGVANGVATLDATGRLTAAQAPPTVLAYSANSTISVKTGLIRLYNDSGATWTILGVRASVGTSSSGASIIVDINVNGTTIFTTQANRPAIAAAANTSGLVTNMDVTSIANGSFFTVDIDQVGSTLNGGDLCVQIEVR